MPKSMDRNRQIELMVEFEIGDNVVFGPWFSLKDLNVASLKKLVPYDSRKVFQDGNNSKNCHVDKKFYLILYGSNCPMKMNFFTKK